MEKKKLFGITILCITDNGTIKVENIEKMAEDKQVIENRLQSCLKAECLYLKSKESVDGEYSCDGNCIYQNEYSYNQETKQYEIQWTKCIRKYEIKEFIYEII